MTTILQTPTLSGLRWTPNALCLRVVSSVLAVAISGRYAVGLTDLMGPAGLALLGGAAVAWLVMLMLIHRLSPADLRWPRLDWAIWTMTVGSVVMAVALLVAGLWQRLAGPGSAVLAILLGGLLVADAAMAWVLTRNAPAVEVTRGQALLIWLPGMNGLLATLVAATWWLERS